MIAKIEFRQTRGLDTAPAPEPVDWALVIRQAILGERAHMTEATGGAIAEYGDGVAESVIADVEKMIEAHVAEAVNKLRSEMRIEMSRQIEAMRCRIDAQGAELRKSLDEIIAQRRRARSTAGLTSREPLLLPRPNGNGSCQ
jgi:hypothetical protein